jgi:uncharacterized membrane protein YphA (DoxX/SURF4 family)
MNTTRLHQYAPAVLRIGIALVFLWFGTQQLLHAPDWTGFIPEFVVNMLPVSPETFVLGNGLFEVIFGIALILGIFVRPVAFILAIHMFGIAFSLGWSAIGIRDFGLAIATTAIFLYGADYWTLDRKVRNKAVQGTPGV